MEGFKHSGLELPENSFQEVVRLQQELSELSAKFSTNISEDVSCFTVSEAEFDGVPADVKSALTKEEGPLRSQDRLSDLFQRTAMCGRHDRRCPGASTTWCIPSTRPS